MAATKLTAGSSQQFILLTAIDADWNEGTERKLHSIQFVPGAADDVLSLKFGTAAGPEIFPVPAATSTEPYIKYFGGVKAQVFIDYSGCTLSSGHQVIIIYEE